jgi:Family of unknown function (DUF6518)
MKRTISVMIGAVAFGVIAAILKGNDAGVRDSIGNISAPWLLLPFFAGRTQRGVLRGAAIGADACLLACVGFYAAESIVLDLGPHSWLTDLQLAVRAGRQYFLAAIICGPLFGVLGAAQPRWRRVLTAGVVGLTLIGEPPAVFLWLARTGVAPSDTGMVTAYPILWIGEMVLGLALMIVVTLRSYGSLGRSRSAD